MAKSARGGGTHACPRRGYAHALGASKYCTLVGGTSDDAKGSDSASPGEEPERRFPCDEPGCEYSAIQPGHLSAHKRTHSGERPYACDELGYEYSATQPSNLETHKRTHTGERPFPCDEPGCDTGPLRWAPSTSTSARTAASGHFRATSRAASTAPDAGTLTSHKRTHSGERPYPCDELGCKYSATQPGTLKKHKRRMHSGERG
ncbi:hypothetical protein T492DRAFT_140945 [Pavlovales sp. CCMP2436]|nr:hypothetical protein T492DRAFT_140945 [Pavlovales sp. CCMP2436]